MQPFNIGGWIASTRIVPVALSTMLAALPSAGRLFRSISGAAKLRSGSRAGVLESGQEPEVRFTFPGPGSDMMFEGLAADLAAIGVTARSRGQIFRCRSRATRPGGALCLAALVPQPVQLRRSAARQCSEDADYLVSLALDARDGTEESSYLYEAETALLDTNLYIPLGAPIRWSLVRADIDAFSENPWNIHPLFPLSRAPI